MAVLTPLITNNILKSSLSNFICSIGKNKEYIKSNKQYDEFITDLVNSGYLSFDKLNEYLFNELSFGCQRSTYIYKINSFSDVLEDVTKLLLLINSTYSLNAKKNFNRIATTYFTTGDNTKELVAFKIIKNINGGISKLNLLYGLRIDRFIDEKQIHEHSYIPIEINLKKKLLIIKVAPKSNVTKDNYKYENLSLNYAEKVIDLFNIQTDAFNSAHKEALYEMCEDLYMQVYNKMVQKKPKGIDKLIESTATTFYNTLKIEELSLKKTYNNVFDVNGNLNKMIEHLLISDMLYNSSEDGQDIEDVDGVATYLCFNDGKNISARISGVNSKDPIYDSETYMALRTPIEYEKKLSVLHIRWFIDYDSLRVCYDTSSFLFLRIHFYKNLEKEDFNYGLEKYLKYESATINKNQGMDNSNAQGIAT
ncbi:hypothetical protein [Clostridium sp.]